MSKWVFDPDTQAWYEVPGAWSIEELDQATGFLEAAPFDGDEAAREFFQRHVPEVYRRIGQPSPPEEALQSMAEAVIEDGWHYTAQALARRLKWRVVYPGTSHETLAADFRLWRLFLRKEGDSWLWEAEHVATLTRRQGRAPREEEAILSAVEATM